MDLLGSELEVVADSGRQVEGAGSRRGRGAQVPMAGLVAGCFLGVACAEGGAGWWPPVLAGILILGSVWAGWAGRWRVLSGLLAWLAFWGIHQDRLNDRSALEEWLRTGESVELEGEVLERRDDAVFAPEAVVRVSSREVPGVGARLRVRGLPGGVLPGDFVRLRGRGVRFAPPRNPGEPDRFRRMKRAGLAGELRVEAVEPLGARRWSLRRWAWRGRQELKERLGWGLDEKSRAAVLIRALVLGDRPGDQMELFGAFRRSGTMHVFAVSGLHVGMVGLLAWWALWGMRVPRGWALWLILLVVWSYALVTGLRPPAMRASIMATVLLLGFVLRRGPALGNTLLASVPWVLLVDSFQWRQAGFQLSYVVVAAIILVAPRFYGRLRPVVEGDAFLPRVLHTRCQKAMRILREKTAGLGAVSAAAWLGSAPLMWIHFGIVTPSAVLASMVLVPIAFVMLGLAIVGLLAGWLAEPAGAVVNQVNGLFAAGAHEVASGFSALPGSYFQRREEAWWGRGLVVFDLRRGDGASYFGAGGGVLLDAGSEREFRRVVFPGLRQAGVEVDSLVVSHADGGHCGGMARAVEAWGTAQALVPVREARSPFFREFLRVAGREDCPVLRGEEGRRYPLAPGAALEVVYAPGEGEGSLADDRGMVLKLHWNGWRILLTGDAGFETEMRLLARGADVASDVWVMGRHASDQTGTLEFLRAVRPRVIVASESDFPPEEQVPEWWERAVRAEGVALWGQGATGAVALQAAPESLELRAFLNEKRVLVLRR